MLSNHQSQISQELGLLTVSRKVVKAIVHREATQVPGVVQLGGDSLLKRIARFLGMRLGPRGIELELADGEAAMTLTVVVRYGTSIPEMAAEMRRRVKSALKTLAGIEVRTVNVYVKSVKAAGADPLAGNPAAPQAGLLDHDRDRDRDEELRRPRRFDIEPPPRF